MIYEVLSDPGKPVGWSNSVLLPANDENLKPFLESYHTYQKAGAAPAKRAWWCLCWIDRATTATGPGETICRQPNQCGWIWSLPQEVQFPLLNKIDGYLTCVILSNSSTPLIPFQAWTHHALSFTTFLSSSIILHLFQVSVPKGVTPYPKFYTQWSMTSSTQLVNNIENEIFIK